jgi:hypothetical protein
MGVRAVGFLILGPVLGGLWRGDPATAAEGERLWSLLRTGEHILEERCLPARPRPCLGNSSASRPPSCGSMGTMSLYPLR